MRYRLLVAGLVAGSLVPAGCRHCRHCNDRYDSGPSASRLDAPTRPSGIPPQSIPSAPPSSVPSLPPPQLPGDDRSSFRLGEPVQPDGAGEPRRTPEAAPPREILLPEPLPGAAATVPASPPKTSARYWLGDPVKPDDVAPAERTAEKPAAEAGPSRSPAGFTRVAGRDGLASGRVPSGGELDWLAANGFRTVVVLHDPKADLGDLAAQAERRNLRAVTIPVDPADLGPAYAAFARATADRGARPVYVADADPARAGALWYLVFRQQELAGDEVARLRANGLGLAPDRGPWWAAVQELLAK